MTADFMWHGSLAVSARRPMLLLRRREIASFERAYVLLRAPRGGAVTWVYDLTLRATLKHHQRNT